MTEASAGDLISNRAMWPDDFHDYIPRISEVAVLGLETPNDLRDRALAATEQLLVDAEFVEECVSALLAGNIVIQGPPGTGKSSVARALASAFSADLYPVTAHEDWSTFEVIGRQELRVNVEGAEQIVPVDGHFTEAVIRCAGNIALHADDPDHAQATWLLIDELNRAHPDRAFGELFSVLGTDDAVQVVLGYQTPGNNLLEVPRRFRIIATVNSIDKQFVNSLSQGLRRRFTFLTLDVPPRRATGDAWGTTASLATREFSMVTTKAVERAVRKTATTASELETFLDGAPRAHLEALFEIVERVRYATSASDDPFVPVGTAPLIDVVELFLIRAAHAELEASTAGAMLDWAASVKLAPLFDAGSVNRDKLRHLADSLVSPFDRSTKRVLLEIESDGLYYA